MAWNEGGGGDKDPWSSRGDKGPPDLDEAFKKLQRQLSGIFGGGGGGGTPGKGFSASMAGIALVIAGIVYGLLGIYQIDVQERGVVYRFGKVQDAEVQQGLHWNPPLIDVVKKENVTQVNSHEHQALMLTEDENIVDVSLTVQYVIRSATDGRPFAGAEGEQQGLPAGEGGLSEESMMARVSRATGRRR